MRNSVWTYNDPKSLLTQNGYHHFFEEALHICATGNMTKALKENMDSISSSSYIFSMSEYLSIVLKNWSDTEYRLEQLFALSDKLELMINNEDNISDKNLLTSFLKNKDEVLDTLRLFSIINLKFSDLKKDEEINKTNYYIFYLLDWFDKNFEIKKIDIDFDKLLISLEVPQNIKKVVFHGFYFVTPEQQIVFEWTDNQQVELVFLNFREMKHEKEFKFISNFIGPEYNWPVYEKWNIFDEKTIDGRGNRFFESLDAHKKVHDSSLESLKLFEFSNFIDFISFSDNQIILGNEEEPSNKMKVLATNAEYMNEKLQEYYPEYYKNYQNFLKFPIGFLLISVHKFWDENKVSIEPKEMLSILDTRFFLNNTNEEWVIEAFSDMMIYFKDCQTKDEWQSRFQQLFTIKKIIERSFEGDSDQDKYLNPDLKLTNDTPFSFLPYLSLSSKTISVVEKKCFEIFSFAEDLLNVDDEKIDLNNHLSKLNKIISTAAENSFSDIESKIILDKIQERLSGEVKIREISKTNISEAINYYLSGNLSDETLVIEPLINIDGEIFRNNKVHVTGLDEKSLPYGEYKLPWPITNDFLEELVESNRYIKLLKYRNEAVIDMTRYLLFLLLQFTDSLELSYIKNYEDNTNLEKSFYLELIDDLWSINEVTIKDNLNINKEVIQFEKMELNEISDDPDVRAAFRINLKRGMYQLINPRVTYKRLLQQEMLVSRIGSILLDQMNDESAIVFLELIFPQFDRFQIELHLTESKGFKDSYLTLMKQGIAKRPFLFIEQPWRISTESKRSIKDLYEQIGPPFFVDFDKSESKQAKENWACPYYMFTTDFGLSEEVIDGE